MSQMIVIGIRYPSDVYPARILLERILSNGLNLYFKPKMGEVNLNSNMLKLGISDPQFSILTGEQFVAPGITTLSGYSDATQEVKNFLRKFPDQPLWIARLVGEIRLEYVEGAKIKRGWIFRSGNAKNLTYISTCWIGQPNHAHTSSSFHFGVYSPWFFLKNWWPEDKLPRYVTPEIAEHNWGQIVNIFQTIIDLFGTEDLEQTSLSIEGSDPRDESDWMIAQARRLPKLIVDFA